MSTIQVIRIVAGSFFAVLVLMDVFLTIVVPRATSRRFRIGTFVYESVLWRLFKKLTPKNATLSWKTEARGIFVPAAFFFLFGVWFLLLQIGFALILLGLGTQVHPAILEFDDACYFAGITILTIGYGDVVPVSVGARVAVILAAICGLLFMALLVSHLFTLQTQLQSREEVVNEMASRAGAPASGVVLLMRYRELEIMEKLSDEYNDWENWLAELLESHRAFPILLYFPSTSAQDSWLSVTGALLDASTLMTCAIRSERRGRAELFYGLGCNAVQSLCHHMNLRKADAWDLPRHEFDQALDLLAFAGFEIADKDLAWKIFRLKREGYAPYIYALADHFDTPRQAWLNELQITHVVQ